MNVENADNYFRSLIGTGLSNCFDISVMKNNKLVYSFREGSSAPADKGGKIITENNCFNIGSVTKLVTASLIIKLVENGQITSDDKIVKFIPEYKNSDVTILNLLTHTSGYDINDFSHIKWPVNSKEMDNYLKSIYEIKAKYKPFEQCLYFSFGYSILMEIIQLVTNDTIEQFARKILFEPLQMNSTTFDYRIAGDNYILPWNKNEERFSTELIEAPPLGDSGLLSTANDLVKFGGLFLNHGFASGKQVYSHACIDFMLREITDNKFMKTPVFWIKEKKDIFGCFGDLNSPQSVAHTGFSGCMLMIDSTYDSVISIVTNSTYLHDDWNNYRKICNLLMTL